MKSETTKIIKTGTLTILVSLTITGCTTVTPESSAVWPDYVTPSQQTEPKVKHNTHLDDQFKNDITQIRDINTMLASLMLQLTQLTGAMLACDKSYITENENNRAEYILFEFMRHRKQLTELMEQYRTFNYPDTVTRTQGASIFMYAGITRNYYTSRLVAIAINNKKLIKLLNAAHSKYGIDKGCYNQLFMSVTDIAGIKLMDTAWNLFEKELYTPNSTVATISKNNPDYSFIKHMKPHYFDTYVQIRYILYASGKIFANVENMMRHTRARKLGDEAVEAAEKQLYHAQGSIFKNVARIKNPRIHCLEFSDQQTDKIKRMLQPGDIILTYSAGYMSNIFLPGNFKHGITYIGTVDERHAVGLSTENIKKTAILPQQVPILKSCIDIAEKPQGYEANVIEAVAEGVIINSLDFLLKTHINRMVVLRPRISHTERVAQLIDLFLHIGVPYDFNFNFSDDTYQCCTELIYRTLNNKGTINFSFSKVNGKWVLSADNIVEYFLNTNPNAFEIILLAENSHINNQAKIITGKQSLQRLHEIMGEPKK